MTQLENHQVIACATRNLAILDEIESTLENDLYTFDAEYRQSVATMKEMIKSLDRTTRRLLYSAEIDRSTELLNNIK